MTIDPVKPRYATARGEPRPRPWCPEEERPEVIPDPHRKRPRLCFTPAECDPYALFSGAFLGPRLRFSWPRLLAYYGMTG
jgi:hypothetical protein